MRNELRGRQRMTEQAATTQRAQLASVCVVEFRRVIFEICDRVHTQRERDTDTLIAILCTSTGREA